jgi:hypothetical protein
MGAGLRDAPEEVDVAQGHVVSQSIRKPLQLRDGTGDAGGNSAEEESGSGDEKV